MGNLTACSSPLFFTGPRLGGRSWTSTDISLSVAIYFNEVGSHTSILIAACLKANLAVAVPVNDHV